MIIRRLERLFNIISFKVCKAISRPSTPAFVGGSLLYVPSSVEHGLLSSIQKGSYELSERLLVQRLITGSDRILEIGAAIGCLAVEYSKRSKQIHVAVEANAQLFPYLTMNLSSNQCDNVKAVHAVGDWQDGTREFFVHKDFYSSSVVEKEGEKVQVASVDLNRLIIEHSINTIICDVEGFEYELFKNLAFNAIKKIIVEIHETKNTEHDVLGLQEEMLEHGFKFNLKLWRGNVLVFSK